MVSGRILSKDDLESEDKNQGPHHAQFSRDEEAKLLRKYDWFILPPLTFM